MRKLLIVSAMAVIALAAGTAAYAEQWPDEDGLWTLEPPDANAFDVTLTVYNGNKADKDGYFYYQWDVTLKDGPFQCLTDEGDGPYTISGFRGFAFETPGSLDTSIANGGSYMGAGEESTWTPLDWKFQPNLITQEKSVGSWSGNDVVPATVPGHFIAGLWSQTQLFDVDNPDGYEVHIHVQTDGGTGYIAWNTGDTNINDEEFETTPELSSSALLLLGALPIGLAWVRRRKR